MTPSTPLVVGIDRPTSGPVSLVQGAYGARGNLELVACDDTDGLWVFWFNADLVTDPLTTPDVPPGAWSTGLAFAGGDRYLDAQILQSVLGPDHLEVLALDARGVLQSWYWSPGPGFQRRTTDAAIGVSRFIAVHDTGALNVTFERDGAIAHLVSPPRGYPARTWLPAADGPSLGADAHAVLVAAGVPSTAIEPGTARTAPSHRGGGMTELTWRDRSGRIRHAGIARA